MFYGKKWIANGQSELPKLNESYESQVPQASETYNSELLKVS